MIGKGMTREDEALRQAEAEYERRNLLRAADAIEDPAVKRNLQQYARGLISARECWGSLEESPNALRGLDSFQSAYEKLSDQEKADLVNQAKAEVEAIAAELESTPSPTAQHDGDRVEDTEDTDLGQTTWMRDTW